MFNAWTCAQCDHDCRLMQCGNWLISCFDFKLCIPDSIGYIGQSYEWYCDDVLVKQLIGGYVEGSSPIRAAVYCFWVGISQAIEHVLGVIDFNCV